MAFLVLVFNLTAIGKLADRGLVPEDVRAVFRVAPVVTLPNPTPRVDGSLYAIGPTEEGRFITVVVEPDRTDDGRWHIRTAWDSTPKQVSHYRDALKGG